jgi:histidinol-phosphate aminotransferase
MTTENKRLFLNRNEVLQGPSPKCLKALRRFDSVAAARYFDGYYGSVLRPKLARLFKLPERQILIGYGLEDIFRTVFDCLNPKTDRVLTHGLHYSYYEKYTKFKGIKLEKFKIIERSKDFAFDVSDCLAKIKVAKPKVIIITSPNNPTGNSIVAKDFALILKGAAKDSIVILDEAYSGFDGGYQEKDFLSLLGKHDNLMILRSFSKLYALAGMRIGFSLCGKKVKSMLRYQDSYLGGSRILEEVAVAALESGPYYRKLAREIMGDRSFLINEANKLKHFKAYDSKANFVMVRVDKSAKPAFEKSLESQKVLISKFVAPDLMRVSIGSRKYTKPFLNLLAAIDKKI